MRARSLFALVAGTSCLAPCGSATADQIPISNNSFEQPNLNPGGFTNAVPPGWTAVGAGFSGGVFNTTGWVPPPYVPDGDQVLYINATSGIEQVLPATLLVDTRYTLSFSVCTRPVFGLNTGMRVSLLAGSNLFLDLDSFLEPPIPQGQCRRFVVSAIAASKTPGLGEPLKLRILRTGTGTQGNFDLVLLDTSEAVCAPDLNGDGIVDFNDFLAFLGFYNAEDPRADFNGDGAIDFNDVLAFLNLYNQGC
jgi:hypothetical protein